MKTPEQLAEEYLRYENESYYWAKHAFLAGYQAGRLDSEGVQAAKDQFADASKVMPQWISVKEREPADETWVLGTNGRDIECAFKHDTDCYSMTTITHWMPLPEPPKDE